MPCTFSFPYIATTIFVIKIHLHLADKWKDKGDNYASSTYKNVEPGRQPFTKYESVVVSSHYSIHVQGV